MLCKCGCKREIPPSTGKRPREFFSANCRKRYQRQNVTKNVTFSHDLQGIFLGVKLSQYELDRLRHIFELNFKNQQACGTENLAYIFQALISQLNYSIKEACHELDKMQG